MKIAAVNRPYAFISDNSQECGPDVAFLRTKLNARYEEDALKKSCAEVVWPSDLYEHLNLDIPLVGVCGTNGKTTTGVAISTILEKMGYKSAFQGTEGFFIGGIRSAGKGLTTPTLLEIYTNIQAATDAECCCFVMEVSSHAIDQERIEGLHFTLKVHTNITSDHLDYHKTLENYIAVKNSFFSDSCNKVINADDPIIRFNPINATTYGIEKKADFQGMAYSLRDGIETNVLHKEESAYLKSSLYGKHNLSNLLASVASVKLLLQEPLESICEASESFTGVNGRLERVSGDPLVIIDFAHTHDGMKKVFEAFPGLEISVVFGAGGDRDRGKRPLMGKVAEAFADDIILTSDNPRSEDPDQIIRDIAEGIIEKSRVCMITDRNEAIQTAVKQLKPGQILLVLGKGDEDYQEINGRKIPMSDRKMIEEALSNRKSRE